jgi:hypothetical protein
VYVFVYNHSIQSVHFSLDEAQSVNQMFTHTHTHRIFPIFRNSASKKQRERENEIESKRMIRFAFGIPLNDLT